LNLLRPLVLVTLLAAATLLQGCFAVIAGGAAVGADTAHDRRPVKTVVSDRNIQLTAFDAINRHKELVRDDNSVKIVVYRGVMLLAGQVRSESLRRLAESSVAGIDGFERVVNEIEVTGDPQGFWRRRQDNALTARVKAALLDITSLPGFDPTRVNVTASHRVVYLMGIVSREEADAVTDIARDVAGVDKVVKLFEYSD
jgi:osmotically-inducible protein OsmY